VPRQNRVTPFGEIVAVDDRGTMMGNRGCLHDRGGRLRRPWQLKRWIICVLEFKGRKRKVMTPGHYTELFFLDEAAAMAAGHRPCAECRRERFNAFRKSLGKAGADFDAPRIDSRLHAARVTAGGAKRTYSANLDDLPDGAFVVFPLDAGIPHLVWGDALLSWSAGGYADRIVRPRRIKARVLTPEFTVRAIRGGYVPDLHRTAHVLLDRQT
jgi:hypothetical protein